jgi:hypothetical protein
MKYPVLVLSLLAMTASAGPVGRYLGYQVGRTETAAHTGMDSVHYLLPSPSDTIIYTNLADTTTVLAETTIGEPAWVLRQTVSGDTNFTALDTVFESGDTLLHQPWRLGDSTRSYGQYLVPFSLDLWWRTGLEGTFYADVDGDGTIDTTAIWADTVRVTGIEDVTVPYGTVPGCYKLRTTLRQATALTFQGLAVRETAEVSQVQWYKDSLWWVKDSSYVFARAYVQVLIWLHAADIVSENNGQLLSLATSVEEVRAAVPARPIWTGPNPFIHVLRLRSSTGHPVTVDIFDAAGRCVRSLDLGPRAVWDGRDNRGRALPAGSYVIHPRGQDAPRPTTVIKTD